MRNMIMDLSWKCEPYKNGRWHETPEELDKNFGKSEYYMGQNRWTYME